MKLIHIALAGAPGGAGLKKKSFVTFGDISVSKGVMNRSLGKKRSPLGAILAISFGLLTALHASPRPTPTPTPAGRALPIRTSPAKPTPSPIIIKKTEVTRGGGTQMTATAPHQNTRAVNDMPVPNKLPPTLMQLPDLQVKSLAWVGTQAHVRVLNAGKAAAGPFNVQLAAAQPSKVSAIFSLFDKQVAGVPPMTSIEVTIDVAPSVLTAGNVTVHLDSKNQVKESNEGNNSASK